MSPVPTSIFYKRLHDAPGDQSLKPTDPNGLVLEAWAQGYMVGSLIIMTCITIANMRRGVLLHKLILIEVSPQNATRVRLTGIVDLWLLARLLYSLQSSGVCVVVVCGSRTIEHLVVATQCDSMDETSTFSVKILEQTVHWDCRYCDTVLDHRDICQFCFLSQHQRSVSPDSTMGSIMSRSVVGGCSNISDIQHQDEIRSIAGSDRSHITEICCHVGGNGIEHHFYCA